jgi:hypothetical protein
MFDLVPHVEAFYIMVLWAVGVFVGQVANRVTTVSFFILLFDVGAVPVKNGLR